MNLFTERQVFKSFWVNFSLEINFKLRAETGSDQSCFIKILIDCFEMILRAILDPEEGAGKQLQQGSL